MLNILADIRRSGGTLPISRGQISGQDVAALSRITGNEFIVFRGRSWVIRHCSLARESAAAHGNTVGRRDRFIV